LPCRAAAYCALLQRDFALLNKSNGQLRAQLAAEMIGFKC
jgi:hypothetical protein